MAENFDSSFLEGFELIRRGIAIWLAPVVLEAIAQGEPQGPRSLSERDSCEYLGIGRTKFRELWDPKKPGTTPELPRPFKCGGTHHWMREDLDRYLNKQSGKSPSHVQRLPKEKRKT
jgi:predicted DNA-binding transcriptional regulator AlpA